MTRESKSNGAGVMGAVVDSSGATSLLKNPDMIS